MGVWYIAGMICLPALAAECSGPGRGETAGESEIPNDLADFVQEAAAYA